MDEPGIHLVYDSEPSELFPSSGVIRSSGLIVLKNALEGLGIIDRESSLSLTVTDDPGIQEINREHRGKDRPTDVLSFPSADLEAPGRLTGGGDLASVADPFSPGGDLFLGDLVISWETCISQAKEIGHSIEDEFFRLLVHGVLHLLGFDHERSTEDEKQMMAREDEILNLLP